MKTGRGSDFSNTPPNLGGGRVVRKRPTSIAPRAETNTPRRALLISLVAAAPAAQLIAFLGPLKKVEKPSVTSSEEGDAVDRPGLELRLQELLLAQQNVSQDEEVITIVQELESRGGSQIMASQPLGRWVIPWLGGWERVWTSQPDSGFLGGPVRDSFGLSDSQRPAASLGVGSTIFSQVSGKQFIYGPGVGGVTTEYLYNAPGVASKILLTREGVVTNLGGNYFELDFPTPLQAYPVQTIAGTDSLASSTPLEGISSKITEAPSKALLKTTYLSERMWIVRSDEQVAVFERTATRAVTDRRGLVADGQLIPNSDEFVRYGKLLFGESPSDYAGWEDNNQKKRAELDKLNLR